MTIRISPHIFNRVSHLHHCAVLVASLFVLALPLPAQAETNFKPIPTQFIAALAEPGATSGTGAETWGLWRVDPGPRGVRSSRIAELIAAEGVSRSGWTFDMADWWLDENGLLMEHPVYGMPPGRYMVTGDREATSVLTVHAKDAAGKQRWDLAGGTTIYDVTHLRCRSARYTPSAGSAACTPSNVPQELFRIAPGAAMPPVQGCDKQDYTVLFVIGLEE